MDDFPYTIAYYLTETGGKPFKDWLDNLKDITARQKVRIRLDRVRLGAPSVTIVLSEKEYMN